MSPEQAQDKGIDARVTFFRLALCSMRWRPGSERSPEILLRRYREILHKERNPFAIEFPRYPKELNESYEDLEKDREDRYQTAHELMGICAD